MIRSASYGVMLGTLILQKRIQEKLRKLIKDLPIFLIMMELNFLSKKKIWNTYKIEVQNNISINVFGYVNKLVFLICISNKKSKDSMDLLLLIKDNKSHYVYIKDFNKFMFHKTKKKKKNGFVKIVHNALVVKYLKYLDKA